MQTLGIIGDVHAQHETLHAALNFLRSNQLDALLCTGDIVDGPGDVNACCHLLQEAGVQTVRGNHDRWFLSVVSRMRDLPDATLDADVDESSRAFLASLPTTRAFETTQGRLLLCHGLGENDMAQLKPHDEGYALQANFELQKLRADEEFRFVIGGHTHRRMVRSFPTSRGSMTVLNAGTLLPQHQPCLLICDFAANQAQFYDVTPQLLIEPAETRALKADKALGENL